MSHWIPCAGCARHVSISETRCPFCDAAREPSAPPARSIDVRGMSRSALLVAGALALGACEANRNDYSSQASGYGGPPQAEPSSGSNNDDASASASTADAAEPTNVVAIYGAPTPGIESKN